jgi:hypothetical protein
MLLQIDTNADQEHDSVAGWTRSHWGDGPIAGGDMYRIKCAERRGLQIAVLCKHDLLRNVGRTDFATGPAVREAESSEEC